MTSVIGRTVILMKTWDCQICLVMKKEHLNSYQQMKLLTYLQLIGITARANYTTYYGHSDDPSGMIIHSLLSGPIDVDKMDYLMRDSLHAGVPYGRHFDQDRLLASLCLDQNGESRSLKKGGLRRNSWFLLAMSCSVRFIGICGTVSNSHAATPFGLLVNT